MIAGPTLSGEGIRVVFSPTVTVTLGIPAALSESGTFPAAGIVTPGPGRARAPGPFPTGTEQTLALIEHPGYAGAGPPGPGSSDIQVKPLAGCLQVPTRFELS